MDANAQEKPGEGDADVSAGRNDAGQTAGQMLRDAREQAGYHLPALAANLKVSVQKLEALEANDWSVFPDVVFTRALASTVCRVLKMDAAPVLALLPKAPESADGLVVLLIAPCREEHGVIAVLPVQPHACHLCFGDQPLNVPARKGDKDFLFLVNRHPANNLHCIRIKP